MNGLTIKGYQPFPKGSLLGFLDFSYGHLIVHRAPVLRSGDKVWINLPSKPRFNHDSSPMLSDKGKQLYEPILSWSSREGGDKVQTALLEMLRALYPGVLEGAQ